MLMRKDIPEKDDLLKFSDRKEAAKHFGVSVRTIVRWLDHYGLYSPRANYGHHKLNPQQVAEIRELYRIGWSRKDLANKFGVTFASISRVIHKITYPDLEHEFAIVQVVYNPH